MFVRFFGTSSESGPETRWSGCRLHLVNSSTSDRGTAGEYRGRDRSVARYEGFGRRGVRRLGTPNLRHALALNWKCQIFLKGASVNASLAKGEPIGGMIASEHNESKTHERGAICTWTKQPTGARGRPSIGQRGKVDRVDRAWGRPGNRVSERCTEYVRSIEGDTSEIRRQDRPSNGER